ncbi:hypothetical protein [Mesorhizobium sp. M0243]|uniref:hypothetical protein n=1 Tax=Mesorhizobium sp. M0243 TaxID=2956925 RepID=UPI0033379967
MKAKTRPISVLMAARRLIRGAALIRLFALVAQCQFFGWQDVKGHRGQEFLVETTYDMTERLQSAASSVNQVMADTIDRGSDVKDSAHGSRSRAMKGRRRDRWPFTSESTCRLKELLVQLKACATEDTTAAKVI